MSTVTKYLPTAWLDEDIPDPQRNPDNFLKPIEGKPGVFTLEPAENPEEWASPSYHIRVEAGQVITFLAHRHYAGHTITVREDGQIDAPTVPEDANSFMLADDDSGETFADSLSEIVRNGFEFNGTPLPAGEYDVYAWHWADTETHFRVVIDGDKARFEPCAGAN